MLTGSGDFHLDHMLARILLSYGKGNATVIYRHHDNMMSHLKLYAKLLARLNNFVEFYDDTILPSQEWENSDAVAILTYFILLISFTFNVLIFCYIGELLVEQVIFHNTFRL